jgi:hypothetical protein
LLARISTIIIINLLFIIVMINKRVIYNISHYNLESGFSIQPEFTSYSLEDLATTNLNIILGKQNNESC